MRLNALLLQGRSPRLRLADPDRQIASPSDSQQQNSLVLRLLNTNADSREPRPSGLVLRAGAACAREFSPQAIRWTSRTADSWRRINEGVQTRWPAPPLHEPDCLAREPELRVLRRPSPPDRRSGAMRSTGGRSVDRAAQVTVTPRRSPRGSAHRDDHRNVSVVRPPGPVADHPGLCVMPSRIPD